MLETRHGFHKNNDSLANFQNNSKFRGFDKKMNIVHNINMTQKISSARILRKRQERLQLILHRALELILSEGLDALTMQKLAERLDYAVGALYRYFDSKDTLLAALQRQVLTEFNQIFLQTDQLAQEQFKQTKTDLLALTRLYLAAEIYSALRQYSPIRFHLLNEMIVSPREQLSLKEGLQVMQVALPLLKHIESLFQAAEKSQALNPGKANQRGIILWTSIQGLIPLSKLTRFVPGYPLKDLQTELLKTLLLGWGAQSEHLQESLKNSQKLLSSPGFQELIIPILERNTL
jgi:AcrR family transcriptional regulator